MRRARAVAAVWALAAGAICVRADAGLLVVVFDYAETPGRTLERSVTTAGDLLAGAGVESVWKICRVSGDSARRCELPPSETYRKRLVNRSS